MVTNIIFTIVVIVIIIITIRYFINKNKNAEVQEDLAVEDKTFTTEAMIDFVKRRLDEITKVNLYDIGLSEEELKRRKAKKYELRKALKGCTYGDVNDKKYVKELIFDLLNKEYGVNETNISRAINFDIPSLLTAQDKFDILIYMYKKDFAYEALTQLIKKYDLAKLKYIAGESKPCYVITPEEIDDIYEKEAFTLNFSDKLNILVQRIYQYYKGYSAIDEVRDMNIDGVSGRSIWTSRKLFKPSCTNRWRLFRADDGTQSTKSM
jgi:pilus assembly protein CpaF